MTQLCWIPQFSELTYPNFTLQPSKRLRIPALPNGKQWRPRRKVKNDGILRKNWILSMVDFWSIICLKSFDTKEKINHLTYEKLDSHVVDLCLFHQWVKCVLFLGTNPTNMLLKHGLKLEPLDFFEDLKGLQFIDFKMWLYKIKKEIGDEIIT